MKQRVIDEARRRLLQMMIASPALALLACGGEASADSAPTPTSPSAAVEPTPDTSQSVDTFDLLPDQDG